MIALASLKILAIWRLLASLTPDTSEKAAIEANQKLSSLIGSQGYGVEFHRVTTNDGYVLGLHRLLTPGESNAKTTPVLLMHGLLGASHDWVLNPRENSLAFILKDQGYDVWMGNVRGNTYSTQHRQFKLTDKQFWDYSLDELALLDAPAIIDYILLNTGRESLYYIGFSMGTTSGFALLSTKPEYNQKVKLLVALAPMARVSNVIGVVKTILTLEDLTEDVLGDYDFLPSGEKIVKVSSLYCGSNPSLEPLCDKTYFLFLGPESTQLNRSRLSLYNQFNPAGISSKVIAHYAQIVREREFQKYDYGEVKNLIKYGRKQPPAYDVTKIECPVALLYGLNDVLATPTDVTLLKDQIKNTRTFYRVPCPEWSHTDFIMGTNARTLVYNRVIDLLNQDPE